MKINPSMIRWTFFGFILMSTVGPLHAQPKAVCRWLPLTDPPAWTVSGAWTDRDSLLLVDARNSQLVEFSATRGNRLAVFESVGNINKEAFKPSAIQKTNTGYAILDADANVSWVGNGLAQQREVDLSSTRSTDKRRRIGSAFEWFLAGDTMLTFSDVELADHSWESGFLRIPADSPQQFSELTGPADLKIDDVGRDLYLYGHPYLTASSSHGYVLAMQSAPAIFEFNLTGPPAIRKLELGSLLGVRPILPEKQGTSTVRALYAAVEKSMMPVGLYFDRDRLFVLYRKPTQHGTEWYLYRIDPKEGRLEATLKLSSSANHLSVIPGPSQWAFVEKGPVLGLGQQSVHGLLMVPADSLYSTSDGRLCSTTR